MYAQMIQDILAALAPFGVVASVTSASVGVLNILLKRAEADAAAKEKLLGVAQTIRAAIEMTDAYLTHRASGKAADAARERELALLWKRAGQELERIAASEEEKRLAEKLVDKGFAWDYSGQWPQNRLTREGLDFSTVRDELYKLERFLNAP
jgi:hypothetical protein